MIAFTYNGVNLGLVKTLRVSQKPHMDPTNTDHMWVKNRFHIRSILSRLDVVNGQLEPLNSNESPAEGMERIRILLMQPRKHFQYLVNDTPFASVLLEADENSSADNGPFPIDCSVTEVAPRTWIIEYEIEVSTQDCVANQDFASNRFETTHDIDHRGYSQITTTGRVYVRTDMKRSPDALRPIVTPAVPGGFRRKSSYIIAEDGLSMAYKFVDTEFYLSPPHNAVDASGRFSITAVPPGAIMMAQVDLRLEGNKNQSKRQLMQQAVLMALRRLEAAGIVRDPIKDRPFVIGGGMTEELFDNVVEVQLKGHVRVGQSLVTGNDQFQASRGFWRGVFFGGSGRLGVQAGKTGGFGRGAFNWARGILQPSKDKAAAANAKARREAEAHKNAVKQNAAADAPAALGNPPQVFGATMEGDFLERFGAPLLGTDQHSSVVDPGLRGNIDFMAFAAAAFRDPCVIEPLAHGISSNRNMPVSQRLKGSGGPRHVIGDKAGRTLVDPGSGKTGSPDSRGGGGLPGGDRVLEELARTGQNADYRRQEVQEKVLAYAAKVSPSLDWLAGRLRRLVDRPPSGGFPNADLMEIIGGAGGILIQERDVLPLEEKPAPEADEFPGWYEAWYCEIHHGLEMNQDALAATKVEVPSVKVRWANPERTIEVRWSARKAGFPPEVPMILNDPNVVLIGHEKSLPTIEIAPDGATPIFEVSGTTVYKTLDENYVEEGFPTPPWLKIPMRSMPAPIPAATIVVTGGKDGAAQDAANNGAPQGAVQEKSGWKTPGV